LNSERRKDMDLIEIASAAINGTVLLGFYIWVRGYLIKMNREVGELKSWQNAVETRCYNHNKQLGKLFDKIDYVKDTVSATNVSASRVEGKLDALILDKGK